MSDVLSPQELQAMHAYWRAANYLAEPEVMHQRMAATLEAVLADIWTIQQQARTQGVTQRPRWPMIILRTPKGWTGPPEVDGLKTEGFWRSHQVPFADMATRPEHLTLLADWLQSYKPEELFDATGTFKAELAALAPRGLRRMGANPHANGGILLKDLKMPDFRDYAIAIPSPGTVVAEATRVMGEFLRDIMKRNLGERNFRIFGPDETASNRLNALFEVTERTWMADTLLSVTDHCLRSRDYVNVIVAGKQLALQYLDMEAAIKHCSAGIGIWEWASNDSGTEPDIVMACAGDVPTLETLAAVALLRQHLPALKIRVINVVNLMKLQPQSEHPHGLSDKDFDVLFTTDKPILFVYHGHPWLIHRLTYRRTNHKNLHVRGYKEEGTTTTPFDMAVLNDLDRFHLVSEVIDRVPRLGAMAAYTRQAMRDRLIEHQAYITQYGQDMPEIRNWQWPQA